MFGAGFDRIVSDYLLSPEIPSEYSMDQSISPNHETRNLAPHQFLLTVTADGKLAFGGVTRTAGAGEGVEGVGRRGLGLAVTSVTGEDNTSSGSTKSGCRQ